MRLTAKQESTRKINPWLAVRNEAGIDSEPVEMLIYDAIGKDPYDESGVGAQDFNAALKAIPANKSITLRINSPGGNVWDGMAIYNMIRAIKDRVTCQVDGIAASSASLIALAGGKLRMPKAALLMMHNPTDMCWGDADDMRSKAEKLDQHKEAIASIYVDNSNMSHSQVMAAMDSETWMTGQQCVDCEMCDELTEDAPIQNNFDLTRFRRAPGAKADKTQCAPKNGAQTKGLVMNRDEMIALLQSRGVTVPQNATDEQLKDEVKKLAAAPAAAASTVNNDAAALRQQMSEMSARLETERKTRITAAVNSLVEEFRVTREEAPKAVTRAIADESYIDELRARPQVIPGSAPINAANVITADTSVRNALTEMQRNTSPKGDAAFETAMSRRDRISEVWQNGREKILPVLNGAGATNTIDTALKRVLILNETVRDFATRVLPLRLFSSVFSNVPLQGTDEVVVPYYPLQTATSSDFSDGDGSGGTGYTFSQATSTGMKKITVNKRKYQPMDYSSAEFRRQPWFDAVRLGKINAEKLGVDVVRDVLSVVTNANFGAASKTIGASNYTSDDVIDLRGIANNLSWPDVGRSLIVDSSIDTALQKDTAYKLALNIGTPSVIQQGKFPSLSGFDYAWMPSLPTNSENLIGFIAFASGILAAFAPIEPAPGVRAQLVAYDVVTDPATGISLNYRHWGLAQADRDYEVIECAYGYAAGVANAIRRLTSA